MEFVPFHAKSSKFPHLEIVLNHNPPRSKDFGWDSTSDSLSCNQEGYTAPSAGPILASFAICRIRGL
jgi:hypothetical protein